MVVTDWVPWLAAGAAVADAAAAFATVLAAVCGRVYTHGRYESVLAALATGLLFAMLESLAASSGWFGLDILQHSCCRAAMQDSHGTLDATIRER